MRPARAILVDRLHPTRQKLLLIGVIQAQRRRSSFMGISRSRTIWVFGQIP